MKKQKTVVAPKSQASKWQQQKQNEQIIRRSEYPLTKTNVILMAISGLMIVVGFLLMLGGANDGEEFNYDIFSTRRTVVGPTIAFLGFVAMAVSIVYKKRDSGKKKDAAAKVD